MKEKKKVMIDLGGEYKCFLVMSQIDQILLS